MKTNTITILLVTAAALLAVGSALALEKTYEYDKADRLVRCVYSNGVTIEYTYDTQDNRETKVVEGPPTTWDYHLGDTDNNYRFSLSELMRMKQLYRETATHDYHCDPLGGELDGYAPGEDPAAQNCTPHSGDYNPQNWKFSVSEMVRITQLYWATADHAYCADPDGEDGFRVGACSIKRLPYDKSADSGSTISAHCYVAGLHQNDTGTRLAMKLVWESSPGEPVIALGYEGPLPQGWTYVGEEQGSIPELRPKSGDQDELGFVWQDRWEDKGGCQGLFSFVLLADLPLRVDAVRSLEGRMFYRVKGAEGEKRAAVSFTDDLDGDSIPDDEETGSVPEGEETSHTTTEVSDVDGDGIPNILDWDSDGDGVSDAEERRQGTNPYDLDLEKAMPVKHLTWVILAATLVFLGLLLLISESRILPGTALKTPPPQR